ncbi:hypothetical protein [Urechidicola croceus]|uniref:Secretion system C-terminal sorting domain-containing protein n=1 Tax=Urechidicola croceus TaxID=1850246 RepID=A0A1D8P3V5_9FLAO|nr:hypothetical protein [Urechidicola croceus]AOW19273.1 hypothetical protein LPB138_00585 [Urechidicola croceus]
MKSKSIINILSLTLFLFSLNINASNLSSATFNNTEYSETQTTLNFFIPEETESVYIFISDESMTVFQKMKIYQRGNGSISYGKDGLPKGTYFYSLIVDGIKTDVQKIVVK